MHRALLTTSLLLLPSLASGASQCMVQPSSTSDSLQSAQQPTVTAQPPGSQVRQPVAALLGVRIISAEEISRVPALRRIASRGAQLTDLGIQHGLRTVFAHNGQSFQVFYLSPDGQGAVGGVMWDATGHNITRQQVSSVEGAIPTVAINATPAIASRLLPEAAATSALQAVASTTHGTTGVATAPRLWVFVDPLCSFSVRAIEQLRPFIAAGRVQVAVVPLSFLGPRSTAASRVMLSKGAEEMVAAWTGNALNGEADATSAATLQANMAVSEALALRGTPTFYWRKADGSEGRQEGLPTDIGAMIASIAPTGG